MQVRVSADGAHEEVSQPASGSGVTGCGESSRLVIRTRTSVPSGSVIVITTSPASSCGLILQAGTRIEAVLSVGDRAAAQVTVSR